MSHQDELTTNKGHTVTRRTVVRGAAHAAWMVPAVSLISAAPAMAAASMRNLGVTASTTRTSNSASAPITFTVTNTSNPAHNVAANALIVTVSFDSALVPSGGVVAPTVASWTGPSGSSPTFSYTYNNAVANGGSATFTGTFTVKSGSKASGNVTITANDTTDSFTHGATDPAILAI